MFTRIKLAWKVLMGRRPAEVQWDELDEEIATQIAYESASEIVPDYNEETEPDHWRINHLVLRAIELYAHHEKTRGPICREEIARRKQPPTNEPIPF